MSAFVNRLCGVRVWQPTTGGCALRSALSRSSLDDRPNHRHRTTNATAHRATARRPQPRPQVTVHPDPPVLKGGATMELDVRYRPLLVGAADATLRLECPELGLYEWGLRLAGTAVNPERGLAFSVPLGGREAQVFR
mgnify:CR=1 FL=1